MSGPIRPVSVVAKAAALFIVVNVILTSWNPSLGKISAYNLIFPGRERFPFGENSAQAYNLSLLDLDALFASHAIARATRAADEYRVVLIGDSSVWGILLRPEATLAGQLNAADIRACGKIVRVYNLGYPTIALTKDLLILTRSLRYRPDLIVWLTTLEALPEDKQLTSPLVVSNLGEVRTLLGRLDIGGAETRPGLPSGLYLQGMLPGRRRDLADLARLQLFGVLWAATGIDQYYPALYPPAQTDFDRDASFHEMQPPDLDANVLAFNILDAGIASAGAVPVILVNEPILVSAGKNSDVRYNFFYPRWAYDRYRQLLQEHAGQNDWRYLDLWDLVPAAEYTNSAIHLNTTGEAALARALAPAVTPQCP